MSEHYKIARAYSTKDLEVEVNRLVALGWNPLAIAMTAITYVRDGDIYWEYYQPMWNEHGKASS